MNHNIQLIIFLCIYLLFTLINKYHYHMCCGRCATKKSSLNE